jgi:hypothetical protein
MTAVPPIQPIENAGLRVTYNADGTAATLIDYHGRVIVNFNALDTTTAVNDAIAAALIPYDQTADVNGAISTAIANALASYTATTPMNTAIGVAIAAALLDYTKTVDLVTADFALTTNSVAPVISPAVGTTGTLMSATTGTWTHNPLSYTYQWNTGGAPIALATAATYTVLIGDLDAALTCDVVATNLAGAAAGATTSNAVTPTALSANSVAPAVTPDPATHTQLLTSTTGTWNATPLSYTYQWYRDAVLIAGQTAATYQCVLGDIGKALVCKVRAVNAGGTAVAVSSNAVTPT